MRSARCPAVDWVLASLGERAGGERGPAEAIDWRRVVAFASTHMVLPAVASRLDRAAVTLPPGGAPVPGRHGSRQQGAE
jgi:hypothetical protein